MGDGNDRRQTPAIHSLHPVTIEGPATAKEAAGWNTHNLGLRIGADLTSAAFAGVLVAPVITIIDRGIIENASNRQTLRASVICSLRTLLQTPHRFIISKPFALIFALYTGTYVTANAIDTTTSLVSSKPAGTVTAGTAKFFATAGANLGLCLWKDRHFAQMFGALSSSARPIPSPTYALFAFRDSLTIFASFNVPPLLAPHLPMQHLPNILQTSMDRVSVAQFVAPAAVQMFSTPMHLLGLDIYNRPTASYGERWRTIKKLWGWSCLARIGRIVPAFGVGGVVNRRVRRRLMTALE